MAGAVLWLSLAFGAQLAAGQPVDGEDSPLTAEDVAQEILQIQEQLGGSIVRPSDEEANPAERQRPSRRGRQGGAGRRTNPVAALRHVALELDLLAHRLEVAGLYEEADGLRDSAQQLRLKARGLAPPARAGKPENRRN